MTGHFENRINRCRPGHGASCALCCGSHNYAMPRGEIEALFLARGGEASSSTGLHPEEYRADRLFADGMQCPHLGIRPEEPGLLSCLVYDDPDRGGEVESYFNGTCRNFYCRAWDDLDDRQVLFAARLTRDWFYYGLLINNIEAVHGLCASYGRPEDVPPGELRALMCELEERLMEDGGG